MIIQAFNCAPGRAGKRGGDEARAVVSRRDRKKDGDDGSEDEKQRCSRKEKSFVAPSTTPADALDESGRAYHSYDAERRLV